MRKKARLLQWAGGYREKRRMANNTRKDDLLEKIADIETAMFLALPTTNGPAPAQQKPEIFRLTRKMAHAAHGVEFLESLLADLQAAAQGGRNLLKEKYDRAGQGREAAQNQVADAIADVETGFLVQAGEKYPEILKGANADVFRSYLRQDLEGLSPRSLELYALELQEAAEQGKNPAIERHNWLAEKLGRPVLPE